MPTFIVLRVPHTWLFDYVVIPGPVLVLVSVEKEERKKITSDNDWLTLGLSLWWMRW